MLQPDRPTGLSSTGPHRGSCRNVGERHLGEAFIDIDPERAGDPRTTVEVAAHEPLLVPVRVLHVEIDAIEISFCHCAPQEA